MAETVEEQTTPKPKIAAVVKRLRGFAKAHDGATAVVEHLGQKGARIVLVGGDGRWGDQVVAGGVEAANEACAEAGVPVKDEWERELVTGIKTGPSEWNYMGGSAARGGGTR
jgi:DNA-binding LacI/PurR family transcriptional regulator